MNNTQAKRHLARLAALHQGCLEADKHLDESARKLAQHHQQRNAVVREHLVPKAPGQDKSLEDIYLEGLRERHHAERLAG